MGDYGTIRKGRIKAVIYCKGDEADYAGCYQLHSAAPAGDKFDMAMEAQIVDHRLVATIDGLTVAYLPIDWTPFLAEVASRPVVGVGSIQWRGEGEGFWVRFDIDE